MAENISEKGQEAMTQLDSIEKRLERIEALLSNMGGNHPVYQPTANDEIAAVQAQGGSLREYFKQRSRRPRRAK